MKEIGETADGVMIILIETAEELVGHSIKHLKLETVIQQESYTAAIVYEMALWLGADNILLSDEVKAIDVILALDYAIEKIREERG